MSAVAIVPARYASTRFPGKVLAPIAGVPMLRRVVEGARQAKRVREVVVATDDERVAEACRAFGAPVVLTSSSHPTGTDRLAEASRDFTDQIVVNVQGDEPLIEGFVVDAAVAALEEAPEAPMSTVVHRAEPDALADPNRVKVVLDRRGFALYFSRAAVPHRRDGAADAPLWQHVGLYAYRREFLQRFVGLAPTPLERAEALEQLRALDHRDPDRVAVLERAEALEQLRALEHGHPIRVAVVEGWRSVPVDVPADVARVEAILAGLARR